MFDIGKQQVAAKCPACGYSNQVTLDQIARQAVIHCGSCRQSIALKDGNQSVGKSISDVNNSIKNMSNIFKKLR